MIEGLLFFGQLVLFGCLLFGVRNLVNRKGRGGLGLFAYHEEEKKLHGDARAQSSASED